MSDELNKSVALKNNPPVGKKPPAQQVRKDKELYEKLTDKEIDKTLQDSFPASDPPSY